MCLKSDYAPVHCQRAEDYKKLGQTDLAIKDELKVKELCCNKQSQSSLKLLIEKNNSRVLLSIRIKCYY